jgi:hypothetical protein
MVLSSDGKTTFGGAVVGGGLDLVTPTSIAYSGGSASVSGGAITFAGVSSISLNGIFTSTYDNYYLVYNGVGSSASTVAISARWRSAGTDASGANYYQAGYYTTAGGTNGALYNGTTTSGAVLDVGDTSNNGTITIFAPYINGYTAAHGVATAAGSSSATFINRHFWHYIAASYDGMTLLPSSGTFTGKIRVYGYRNS